MASIGLSRVLDGVLTSADSASISIITALGVLVVTGEAVTPTSAGVYSYDISSLSPGEYVAQWTFEEAGQADDTINRPFTIDSPVASLSGISLADIERGVARRIGPFYPFKTRVGSSTDAVLVRRLQSTLTIGDYEDMYLLRRGRYADNNIVTDFNSDDRHRIVDTYDNVLGSLTPDAEWAVAPVENELLELHSLDPESELRYAVQEGLQRCFFWDVIEVSATGNLRELNLTGIAPWITRKAQVRRLEYGRSSYLPTKAPWFDTYQSGGSVILQTAVPSVGSMRVHVLRPHSSYVNGEFSGVGPDNDNDILHIDREYAIRAGHLHAWINFPYRLQPLAAQSMQLSAQDVANGFTVRSAAIVGNDPEFIQNEFGQADVLDNFQIGNI